MKNIGCILLWAFPLLINSCQLASESGQKDRPSNPIAEDAGPGLRDSSKFYFPYNLENTSSELQLSKELREVSALSLSYDGAYILAVNDEQGKIFFLDFSREKIVHEIGFGVPGDYEGVEMVGSKIYVARSDGVIFEVEYKGSGDPVTKPYYTALTADHDVEGLGYDKANHRLLVACKGKAGEGPAYEGKRAIYGFSLDSMALSDGPIYLLSEETPLADEAIREAWWQEALGSDFAPSGIAVHPISGHLYLLSSRGKARAVLILSRSGELIHMRELSKDLFNQPEGICFEPDGTLYISTEAKGKKGKGKVFRFVML